MEQIRPKLVLLNEYQRAQAVLNQIQLGKIQHKLIKFFPTPHPLKWKLENCRTLFWRNSSLVQHHCYTKPREKKIVFLSNEPFIKANLVSPCPRPLAIIIFTNP